MDFVDVDASSEMAFESSLGYSPLKCFRVLDSEWFVGCCICRDHVIRPRVLLTVFVVSSAQPIRPIVSLVVTTIR